MTEDIWEEMVKKYGIHGYDNTTVIINYETLIEITKKAEKWDRLDQPSKYNLTKYMECSDKLEAVKIAYEDHRDNILELSGKLSEIAHDHEIPEEYHYTLEKIATNMISYGELRKILEAEG